MLTIAAIVFLLILVTVAVMDTATSHEIAVYNPPCRTSGHAIVDCGD